MFDVALEGNTVLDNYDMLAETGGTKGVALEEDVPGVAVSDGVLNLDLTAVTSVAIIRGIEIIPAGGLGNVAPTISATPNPAIAIAGQTSVVDLTTNDANGDPVTVSKTSGPAFATLVNGNTQLQVSPQAGDVAGSPYTVTLQASDGTDTSSVNVTVNVIAPGSALYRINAGGPTLSDPGGDWVAVGTTAPPAPGSGVTFTNGPNAADGTNTDAWDMSQITSGAPVELFGSIARTTADRGQRR